MKSRSIHLHRNEEIHPSNSLNFTYATIPFEYSPGTMPVTSKLRLFRGRNVSDENLRRETSSITNITAAVSEELHRRR